MKKILKCAFHSIEDQFNFGRYNGLSLADVLDINPSYINWCVKYCTGVIFQLDNKVIEDIKNVYPQFLMDNFFVSKRIWHLQRKEYEELDDEYIYDVDTGYNFYTDAKPTDGGVGFSSQIFEVFGENVFDTIYEEDLNSYWNTQ